MRIAIVHSFYSSDQPSGENELVDASIRILSEAGHSVRWFGYRTDDLHGPLQVARSVAGVATRHMGREPWSAIADWAPDIVHVHNTFPHIGTSSIDKLGLHGTPLVLTVHNFRMFCSRGTLSRPGKRNCLDCLENRWAALKHRCYRDSIIATLPLAVSRKFSRDPLLEVAQRIICLTDQMKHSLELLGVDEARLRVVPNFSGRDPVNNLVWEKMEADRPLSGLFVGRLAEEKGVLDLLNGWDPGVPLSIVGSGPLEDEVRRRCVGAIKFIGKIDKLGVRQLMASSTALVFPSTWREGLPLVYVEALAAGLPILASSGNVVSDAVLDEGTGLVIETASMAETLVARRVDLDGLNTHCRSVHSGKYSAKAHLAGLERLYQSVLR